ncbi:WD40 repeat domain-containing protein [Singulisphaera sp. PoT]|uniref:WD40 repeat domain-containing protein n=1 Tax=Singulisphaera sp. PoT TaxID=3411797 RepID=UPI003BF4FC3E
MIGIRRAAIGTLGLVMLSGLDTGVIARAQEIKLVLAEKEIAPNSEPVTAIAFSPDGRLIATGHGRFLGLLQESLPGLTILRDARTGKRLVSIPALKDGVESVVFSPDGKTLAILEYVGDIRLINVPEGREIRKFDLEEEERIYASIAFFPDGKSLVAGMTAEPEDPANEAVVLDVATGKKIRTLVGHVDSVASVAVSPDGARIASGSHDGTVKIWDARTGNLQADLTSTLPKTDPQKADDGLSDFEVKSVAFSPDGRTVAAAMIRLDVESASVEVWEVPTGKSKGTLKGLDPEIRQVVFTPDGKSFATVGSDGDTRLWDTATFKESGKLRGYWPLAFSPDGKKVSVTVDIKTVLILDAPRAQGR